MGCPDTLFTDEKTREILEQIDYDFSQLKVPVGTRLTVCIRAKKIDDYVMDFLDDHPNGVVLHLGCGLDTRYDRVNNGNVEWYDLDMPEVIDLRKNFFQETDRYHMIPSSVTNSGWAEMIPSQSRPVMVIAEGLMMYLMEEEVKSLILKLKKSYPGCEFVFDAYSTLAAKSVKSHPSIRRTGAVIHWGIDDAKTIEEWEDGIRLREEWYFTQSDAIKTLAFGYQLIFKLTGLFSVARKAHRILYYAL
ncbi:MAG: class I SAM-dependent methyltransferase [candidate division Zixibacteria bacterium]|nr:class I SAM-dependent methyltransferase [candidate division Zixibacteria bacterium]